MPVDGAGFALARPHGLEVTDCVAYRREALTVICCADGTRVREPDHKHLLFRR